MCTDASLTVVNSHEEYYDHRERRVIEFGVLQGAWMHLSIADDAVLISSSKKHTYASKKRKRTI